MTATKGDFAAWDPSTVAAGDQWDALFQQRRTRHANRMTADMVQPIYAASYEVVAAFDNSNDTPKGSSGYAETPHQYRLNAPRGAWTWLVPYGIRKAPRGMRQVSVKISHSLPSGETAYVMLVAPGRPLRFNAVPADPDVQSISGTGSANTSVLTFDLDAGIGGLTEFGIVAQTTSFQGIYQGVAKTSASASNVFTDEDATGQFGRPALSLTSEGIAEIDVADWWARLYSGQNFTKVKAWDGSSFTDHTTNSNDRAANTVSPFPSVANGDYVAFGLESGFHALMLDMSTWATWTGGSVAWQYYNGAWTNFGDFAIETQDWTDTYTRGNGVNVTIAWDDVDDWQPTTIDGDELYWVRSYVTTAPTGTGPTYLWARSMRSGSVPWSRVAYTTADDCILASPRASAGRSGSDCYLVGQASFLDVYAVTVMPVAHPDIT